MIDASNSLGAGPRHRSAQERHVLHARLALCLTLLGVTSAACGGGGDDHPPPPAAADGSTHLDNSARVQNYDPTTADARDQVADGECTAGMKRECRVYLPAHDGIQPCFVGEQRCVDTHWSECQDALLVDANLDDSAIAPYP